MTISELFKDAEYCKEQLLQVREAFGNKTTTREQYNAMEKCLSAMYCYCPESIQRAVYITLLEAEKRRIHFELHFWIMSSS
jgi:hypothetical protein